MLVDTAAVYDPSLYDLVIPGDFAGDIAWYVEQARSAGGDVLELAAGTGRVTIPIAEAGVEVWALDVDAAMLGALDRKLEGRESGLRARVHPVDGSMSDFALGRSFALVICPFRAFLHNLTRGEQLACLTRAFEHLRPGGAVAFNVFHPSLEYMAGSAGPFEGVWRWVGDQTLSDGRRLVRSEAHRYSTVEKRVASRTRYEICGARGEVEKTFVRALELAYLYPDDIRSLLGECGFVEVEIFGGFDERPFTNDREELVVRARRPAL